MDENSDRHNEEILADIWNALGILLGLVAFLLLSVGGLVTGDDPAGSLIKGAGVFLLLLAINRSLAVILRLDKRQAAHSKDLTSVQRTSDAPPAACPDE